jgi:hypothetical protein
VSASVTVYRKAASRPGSSVIGQPYAARPPRRQAGSAGSRASAQALDRAANIRVELPDYYLLLDPASWDPTRRHWYLGLLHRAAPALVVPAATTTDQLQARIATLASGRWWPDLDRLLADIDRVVPDRL